MSTIVFMNAECSENCWHYVSHYKVHIRTNCCLTGRDGWRLAHCSAMHESPLTTPTPLVLSFFLPVFLVAVEPNEIITWHNFYQQLAHFQHGWVKWKPNFQHWHQSRTLPTELIPHKGRSQ